MANDSPKTVNLYLVFIRRVILFSNRVDQEQRRHSNRVLQREIVGQYVVSKDPSVGRGPEETGCYNDSVRQLRALWYVTDDQNPSRSVLRHEGSTFTDGEFV